MVPAFDFSRRDVGAGPKSSAAAAVLAGHFMIWSGPAATAHQRKFVPDWWTCVFIQPLGLAEDVAVVLATWAGTSAANQKSAEIALYFFMLAMNAVRAICVGSARCSHACRERLTEHLVVFALVVVAVIWRLGRKENPFVGLPVTQDAPPTSAACASSPVDTQAMLRTAAWMSFLAVAFRLVARLVRWCLWTRKREQIVGGPSGCILRT
jgi:hypothetical protein